MNTKVSSVFLLVLVVVNCHDIEKRQASGGGSSNYFSNGGGSLPKVTNEDKIIDSIQEIALDISANQWEKGNDGNVVQSPVSISALLSLLLLGSRGPTHSELKLALHYPNDFLDNDIHKTYKRVLESIGQSDPGVEVFMSTRLFLQEGLSIIGEFTQRAEDNYKSRVRGLNFAVNPIRSMNRINDWVDRATYGKIKDLISSPFSPDTKFVAANVIYFDGEWEVQFSKPLTKNGLFDTGKANITIPMMRNLMNVPFLGGDQIGFDMIALPYKGGKYSMYILTPRGTAGIKSLQRVEYNLNSQTLERLIGLMNRTRVSVQIPRMKLSHKMYLKDDLKALGVTSMFDRKKSNFERLTTQSGIFVNDIVHEAILEVTETGTVAAAASAATFDRIGGSEVFQLNRPSLLFIRDNINGLTLFWARVVRPEPIFS